MTVPPTQATYWIAVEPKSSARSNVPSPRDAIAHEASTVVWPCRARHSGPPAPAGAPPPGAAGGRGPARAPPQRPAGQRGGQRDAHREEPRVHEGGGDDRRADRPASADDREGGELRRPGEDDRRHDDRRGL